MRKTVSLFLALALALTISVMAAWAKSPDGASGGGLVRPEVTADSGVPNPDTGASGLANVAVVCGVTSLAVAGAAALKR